MRHLSPSCAPLLNPALKNVGRGVALHDGVNRSLELRRVRPMVLQRLYVRLELSPVFELVATHQYRVRVVGNLYPHPTVEGPGDRWMATKRVAVPAKKI